MTREMTREERLLFTLKRAVDLIRVALPDVSAHAAEDFIMADWPEGDAHLEWLYSAPAEGIAAWAIEGLRNWDTEEELA